MNDRAEATTTDAPEQARRRDQHYFIVVKAMAEGLVVPFLGAGASLCDRPAEAPYDPANPTFLPDAKEVATFLADEFAYEEWDREDLLRMSQYVDVMGGREWLYKKLHGLFAADYQPNSLHRFLASLPQRLFADRGLARRHQLIVTTNWDAALEQAFDDAGERFHLVWYVAEGEDRGKFRHRDPNGEETVVEDPNHYLDVSTKNESVILKIHGGVDRSSDDWDRDSYVVTEDHYIEYLTDGTNLTTFIPIELARQLTRANFLFLGYSLRDWNFRVILNRIFRARARSAPSWAVQRNVQEFDEKFWKRRDVELRDEDLASYIRNLEQELVRLPNESGR